jgi:hypothetical protein
LNGFGRKFHEQVRTGNAILLGSPGAEVNHLTPF